VISIEGEAPSCSFQRPAVQKIAAGFHLSADLFVISFTYKAPAKKQSKESI
jgi:hypothetical protein